MKSIGRYGAQGSALALMLAAATATHAFGAGEIDSGVVGSNCTDVKVRVLGWLQPGATGVVTYSVVYLPPHGGESFLLDGRIDVVGDDRGRFMGVDRVTLPSPLCGWFTVSADATLMGANTVDLDVRVPAGGTQLDCCTASLGDFVWHDLDRDGVQDEGEPGIPGVRVVLQLPDGGETRETVTDDTGFYGFTGLCPIDILIDLDESTLPDGFSPTEPGVGDDALDSDEPLDLTAIPVTFDGPLASDCRDDTFDFGFVTERCTGRVGDFVWRDEDGDGVQGADEDGIPGVVLTLTSSDGEVLTTSTDESGGYAFEGLCAGTYGVSYDPDTAPSDLAPTLVDVGDDDFDSDPNPTTAVLDTDDAEDLSLDFGLGPCDECRGKATWLSLRYDGTAEAAIRVVQKNDDIVFDAMVPAGGVFTFAGTDKGTLGTEIELLVNGDPNTDVHTSCSQPLGAGLVFGEFTVVAGASKDGGLFCPLVPCAVTGEGELELGSDEVEWEIENVGAADVTIERITLAWPADNGDLRKVELGGDEIFDGDLPPSSAVIEQFEGDEEDRTLEEGKDEELELKFDDVVSGEYTIRVDFVEGCSVDFVPGPGGGGEFDCSKPIDALTMIWDGDQAIRVKAWKGEPGSELLADADGIAVGDELTVAGYAGSPNDVSWELFAAGTDVFLGESQFHLSCSDDDMDGADDCGSRQGNNKNDEDDLINDWIFEGLVDDDETLDCTP